MKLVNRTTRKDNNEKQITDINYDQNSMSIIRKCHKLKLASDKT